MTRTARLWAALTLLMVAACAQSRVEDPAGGKPQQSTETGNPPVIDISAIALVVRSDEVHIVGDPGAVDPGAVEIRIVDLESGAEQRVSAAQDGSFDVLVAGSPDDTYAVHAVGADDALSAPVYVYRGGASVAEDLSCQQRADAIGAQLAQAAADVDRSCMFNSDCTQLVAPSSCSRWSCGGPAASRIGSSAAASAIEAIAETWCEAFEQDGCMDDVPSADCASPGPVACIDRQCVNCYAGGCEQANCVDTCSTPSIEWTVHTAGQSKTYVLTDCKTLSAPSGCTSDPPCTVARGNGDRYAWSIADIQNLLAAPDVQQALESGGSFGGLTPGGFFTTLVVDGASFISSDFGCGSQQDCRATPAAVSALLTALSSFATQYACGE